MILTIEFQHADARDLGYLLHKNPDRVQSVSLPFGTARIFYPVVEDDCCRIALLLDIDPLGLVKKLRRKDGLPLLPYVNDRPYVASSFMSVAIAKCFGTAMGGRSKDRQELADTELPLRVAICPLPCRGGENLLNDLFEPLGYSVEATRLTIDDRFPDWGESSYFDLRLQGSFRISRLLAHLYVLIPVLDREKHYWVGTDEVQKLLSKGKGWLEDHPKKELIAGRYLSFQRYLTREALQLLADEDEGDRSDLEAKSDDAEQELEAKITLNEERYRSVIDVLEHHGASTIVDFGCGEGKFLRTLLRKKRFTQLLGLDVSLRSLEFAAKRLHMETMPERQRERIKLAQGSLLYYDKRLVDFDAVCVLEVIEHMDLSRLEGMCINLFEALGPPLLIITTPNRDYNAVWDNLPAGHVRHHDHRFEWTREEFGAWAETQATRGSYSVEMSGIGPVHEDFGCPTQMAVFTKEES